MIGWFELAVLLAGIVALAEALVAARGMLGRRRYLCARAADGDDLDDPATKDPADEPAVPPWSPDLIGCAAPPPRRPRHAFVFPDGFNDPAPRPAEPAAEPLNARSKRLPGRDIPPPGATRPPDGALRRPRHSATLMAHVLGPAP